MRQVPIIIVYPEFAQRVSTPTQLWRPYIAMSHHDGLIAPWVT